jgi:hypothetical protein
MAAATWADLDQGAQSATENIEAWMRTVRPRTMRAYDESRAAGVNRIEALWTVARSGAEEAAGNHFRAEAAAADVRDRAAARTADDPRTVRDEHLAGLRVSTQEHHVSQGLRAHAAAVASFPTSIRGSLGAQAERPVLRAAPQRPVLTAARPRAITAR